MALRLAEMTDDELATARAKLTVVYGSGISASRTLSLPGETRATENGTPRRMEPGTSGNPGGRPRAAHSIQELARKHAPEAIKTLVDIARKGTPGARVSAAIALLDRAYGKAPFSTTDPGTFKRAIDMSDDELAAIVAGAKLTLVKSDD